MALGYSHLDAIDLINAHYPGLALAANAQYARERRLAGLR
jgi:hypothetical protein